MSDKINTGGPAFPLSPDCAISPIRDMTGADISSGMSLRAYIATSALSGLCAHPDTWGLDTPGLAKEACRLADALIAVSPRTQPHDLYRVTLIRTVEEAAVVTVEAGSEEEARFIAPFEDDLDWVVDDITRKPETLKIEEQAQ